MPDFPSRPILEHAALVFAALFPIVNPIGGSPLFLVLTSDLTHAERAALSRQIGINAFVLVLASIFLGSYVIEFFGLSVPVIQVAGGLLICAMAWELLHSEEAASDVEVRPRVTSTLSARAFYPMTLPLTVGPGSISIAITLGAQVPRGVSAWTVSIVGAALGAALLALSIWLLFRNAERLTRALGATGTQVLLRLSAFILLCIGVQIIWSGVFSLIGTIPTFRAR
jgi:multiple antibiotic resistance protein